MTGTKTVAEANRFARFTTNGTFTVPAGVFFVNVIVCGGGAGATANNVGAAGSASTVALGAVTITGPGMASNPTQSPRQPIFGNATPNTGDAGRRAAPAFTGVGGERTNNPHEDNRGNVVIAGGPVTPGGSVTVTIGNGGSGTSDGGSGFAQILWEV